MAITEKIPLLKEGTVKMLVPEINANVDGNLLKRLIVTEQEKALKPILDYCLYDEIYTQVTTNTLSAANQILMDDYIAMILSLSVYKRLVLSSTFQIENTGLRKKLSDNSEGASRNDISFMQQNIGDDITYYTRELTKYICDNQSTYPLYFNCTDGRLNTIDRNRHQGGSLGFNVSKVGYNPNGFNFSK